MHISTYSQFAQQTASEKIGLVILDAGMRVIGWQLHTGSVYKLVNFEPQVLVEVTENGTPLTLGVNDILLTAGQYYHDRIAQILYMRAFDSTNPNGKFVSVVFKNFFCTPNGLVTLPNDFASGFEVPFLPIVQDTSDFGVELDNTNQLGVAIEGSGSVRIINDQDYWKTRFDKFSFENQKCLIYSWTRALPASQARLLFQGFIQKKTYSAQSISFSLKDSLNALRAPVPLNDLEDIVTARLTNALKTAKQRAVYGFVFGHRPTNIDAVLQGYPLTGTVEVVNGSPNILGTGTLFNEQISPEDQLYFVTPVGTRAYAVKSVTDDVNLVLNENYSSQSNASVGFFIKPKYPKRYINREFIVAGHSLREPTPLVSVALPNTANRIEVDSVQDLFPGDEILVGSEATSIQRISGNQIKLTSNLSSPPLVGTVVTRTAVTNVHLGEDLLVVTRDYTYSALNGTLTLDPLAEFNIAPIISLSGTLTFNGTRTVSGSGCQFKTQLKAGDWVKRADQFDYFEVLTVIDDNLLVLRTAATYSATGAGLAKQPKYYVEDNADTILTCDVLGKTDDGTPDGNMLATVPEIVTDLLEVSGVGDLIDYPSFAEAIDIAPQRVGVVIPKKFNDRNTPKLKDIINELNKSVFGSLVQNNDFMLAYHVLRPKRSSDIVRFVESDILKFSVSSSNDKIARLVKLRYLFREYEPISRAITFEENQAQNNTATYLSKSSNEQVVDTNLVDSNDGRIAANRWAFLVGVASNVIAFTTKMQGADLNVNDAIEFRHEKLYQRIGSFETRKIAAVQSAKKSITDSTIEIEDLSNAFSRCGIITENGVPNFDDSSSEEQFYGSFITDTYGMQNNDPSTFGINLIW